ncbi:unnamed protein product, partial [Ectocarpus sp. 12 AP-2014]
MLRTAFFFSTLSPLLMVESHLYLAQPTSRQYYQTAAFQETPGEYCPHCYNFRGVAAVQERGGGGPWPHLKFFEEGKLNINGNYMETNETSVRHTSPCGDPVQTAASDETNAYGLANSNYPVLTDYRVGSEFQAKVVVSTYHWGHIELNLCDASELEEDSEVTTHECLSKYPLDRAPAEMEPPIDPVHPGRYFLDPPCRAAETDQSFDTSGAEAGDIVTMTYRLPPVLTCEQCVLQMMYYVSNACVHPGYAEFESDDFPRGCAPTKDNWISKGMELCGTEGINYVEEFASCADISITGNNAAEMEEKEEEEEDTWFSDMSTDAATFTTTTTTTTTTTSHTDDSCDCSSDATCVDIWKQCAGG